MLKTLLMGLLLFFSTSLFAMTLSEVNLAPDSKLMEIKGIGAKKAKLIIQERRKTKFKSMNALLKIKGIGKKILLNIKNDVKKSKKSKVISKKKVTKKSNR